MAQTLDFPGLFGLTIALLTLTAGEVGSPVYPSEE